MALKSGDRTILVQTADGVTVATGPVQSPTKEGDRCVLVETADGVTVPALVVPITKSGQRGVLAKTADNVLVPVMFIPANLYAWGYNYYGQLGLGDYSDRNTPTEVSSGWDAVVAGGLHSLGLIKI